MRRLSLRSFMQGMSTTTLGADYMSQVVVVVVVVVVVGGGGGGGVVGFVILVVLLLVLLVLCFCFVVCCLLLSVASFGWMPAVCVCLIGLRWHTRRLVACCCLLFAVVSCWYWLFVFV